MKSSQQPTNYHTDQTNLHSIVRRMAVSATTVKVLAMAMFITLLLIDFPAVARAIVGNLVFLTAWWADSRFLQYERQFRDQTEGVSYQKNKQHSTFWSWSIAPYYGILLISLLLLLISKEI